MLGSFAGDHSKYEAHVISFNIHCTGKPATSTDVTRKKIIVIRNVVSQAHSKPNSRIMMFTRTILPHIYKTQAPRQLPCTVKTRGTKKSHVPLSQQNRYVPAKIVINNTNKLSKSGTHTKSKYRCHTTSPAVSGTFSQESSRKY